MITGNQIDQLLVEKISGDLPCAVTGNTHYKTQRGIIAEVLAWLANNPIEPTPEQLEDLRVGFYSQSGKSTIHLGAIEFQRIAYLKKEPKLPQELIDVMLSGEAAKDINLRIIKAYKIGKGEAA